MRFPVNLPPVITVSEELRDIPAVNALTVARPIGERTIPYVVRNDPEHGHSILQQPRPRNFGARSSKDKVSDRRLMCRRIYSVSVILDTRSGKDRRQRNRREEEIAHHIAIKA